MYMNERMDEGDIIYQEKTEIGEDETTGELWDRLKIQGADLLIKTLKSIEEGTAPKTAQIDWGRSANQIKNKIRGLNPIMGAYSLYKGKKIKFWKVQVFDDDYASAVIQKNGIEKTTPR